MTKYQFFFQLFFQLIMGIFFIFMAIQLLPITGWNFSTILCCLFATNSFLVAIRMFTTYCEIQHMYLSNIEKMMDEDESEQS